MKIVIGSDHGGFDMKEAVKVDLKKRGIEFRDLGCHDKTSVDYPDYAKEVAVCVLKKVADMGVLVCTTGIGMSIAANKFGGIRAALCLTPHMAKMARMHNNANVLVLAGGLTPLSDLEPILNEWFGNTFDSTGRHQRRVEKIAECAQEASKLAC